MNFAFFGTPDLAVTVLDALEAVGYEPSVVVTAPDRPVGRKQIITPPSVKVWAEKRSIPILQPENAKSEEFRSKLASYNPQLSIVIAYGQILTQSVIDLPEKGTLNIHYSLLPRWRGATPTEAAILAGDKETGVTIQKMEAKLDTGPIIAQHKLEILPDERTPDLRERLTEIGAGLLVETLPMWMNGEITAMPQDDAKATTCGRLSREDGEVKLNEDPIILYRKFRAYYPWPGIYFFQDEKRVKITEAHLEGGKFVIDKVIPEGKPEMAYSDFKN
jgi:methionyl-tRNA formyltransferase